MSHDNLRPLIQSLLKEFDHNATLSLPEIQSYQHQRIEHLARFCATHSPHFAQRLSDVQLTPAALATCDGFQRLPVLTRRALQSAGEGLFCRSIPKGHMPSALLKTSGSTGEPVSVRRTAANQVYYMALGLMEHTWHKSNFTGRLCVIRAPIQSYKPCSNWGHPTALFHETGPMLCLPVTVDVSQLVAWISDFQPHQLLLMPSVLRAMTTYCQRFDVALPALSHIRTIGETLLPAIRQQAQTQFNAKITDVYSSQEIGMMALQCPDSDLYHVVAPNCYLEVLRADGQPCEVGETGRVVVTDLQNYATPLIRYDIGDYAEVGPPCACGRGWPTLKRILGRERNLMILPDGTRHWPLTGFDRFREIAPIQQYQFIQTSRETMDVRLVVERPLKGDEEEALRHHMQQSLGYSYIIAFQYFDQALPRSASGKFEEFLCLTD